MKTLNLIEASAFLKMHAEEVRQRAKAGKLPGAKLGKRWVFLEDDLVEYLRSFYRAPVMEMKSSIEKDKIWHCSGGATRGGLTSQRGQESVLDALLKQETKIRQKNFTTN